MFVLNGHNSHCLCRCFSRSMAPDRLPSALCIPRTAHLFLLALHPFYTALYSFVAKALALAATATLVQEETSLLGAISDVIGLTSNALSSLLAPPSSSSKAAAGHRLQAAFPSLCARFGLLCPLILQLAQRTNAAAANALASLSATDSSSSSFLSSFASSSSLLVLLCGKLQRGLVAFADTPLPSSSSSTPKNAWDRQEDEDDEDEDDEEGRQLELTDVLWESDVSPRPAT